MSWDPPRPVPVVDHARETVRIVLLIGTDDARPYGTETPHGRMFRATKDDLFRAIRFVYGCRHVDVIDTFLVP